MAMEVAPAASVGGHQERLAYDGWVTEFDAFRSPGGSNSNGDPTTVPLSARSGLSSKFRKVAQPSKPAEELEAEMKLLNWHKLANQAALKAALLKTRKIKSQGGGFTRPVPATTNLAMPIEERAAWMQQVIEEEQSKPLQVTKEFIAKYEEEERCKEMRLDNEVATHVQSLRKLRQQVEQRGTMRARRAMYRSAQKELEAERGQLLEGKLGAASSRAGTGSSPPGAAAVDEDEEGKVMGALNTVLGSLDKLVDLEKRISSLERSNVYDDFRASQPPAGAGGAGGGGQQARPAPGVSSGSRRSASRLSFSKQRTETSINAPSQTYYSVRVGRPTARGALGQTRALRARARAGAVAADQGAGPRRPGGGRGGSTFLTSLPDVNGGRWGTGGRSGAAAAQGSRRGSFGPRSAVMEKRRQEAKKKLAREAAERERIERQNRIVREWVQRKKATAAAAAAGAGARVAGRRAQPAWGAASGRRTSNPSMQQFHDIRAQYSKRKDALRRDLRQAQRSKPAFSRGTRTTRVAHPPPAPSAARAAARLPRGSVGGSGGRAIGLPARPKLARAKPKPRGAPPLRGGVAGGARRASRTTAATAKPGAAATLLKVGGMGVHPMAPSEARARAQPPGRGPRDALPRLPAPRPGGRAAAGGARGPPPAPGPRRAAGTAALGYGTSTPGGPRPWS